MNRGDDENDYSYQKSSLKTTRPDTFPVSTEPSKGCITTIIILILCLVYAIIMIVEPLEKGSSSSNLTSGSVSVGGVPVGSSISVGSKLNETKMAGGVEYEGYYELRKHEAFWENMNLNTTTKHFPFNNGFNIMVGAPFNSAYYYYDFYLSVIVNEVYSYVYIENEYGNISSYSADLKQMLYLHGVEDYYLGPKKNDLEFYSNFFGENAKVILTVILIIN